MPSFYDNGGDLAGRHRPDTCSYHRHRRLESNVASRVAAFFATTLGIRLALVRVPFAGWQNILGWVPRRCPPEVTEQYLGRGPDGPASAANLNSEA